MYCVKCKTATNTVDAQNFTSTFTNPRLKEMCCVWKDKDC